MKVSIMRILKILKCWKLEKKLQICHSRLLIADINYEC